MEFRGAAGDPEGQLTKRALLDGEGENVTLTGRRRAVLAELAQGC